MAGWLSDWFYKIGKNQQRKNGIRPSPEEVISIDQMTKTLANIIVEYKEVKKEHDDYISFRNKIINEDPKISEIIRRRDEQRSKTNKHIEALKLLETSLEGHIKEKIEEIDSQNKPSSDLDTVMNNLTSQYHELLWRSRALPNVTKELRDSIMGASAILESQHFDLLGLQVENPSHNPSMRGGFMNAYLRQRPARNPPQSPGAKSIK